MSATVSDTPAPTNAASPQRRKARALRFHAVDWRMYSRLLRTFEDRPRVRITYDRGELELMVTSSEHEGDVSFLARLIAALTEEFGLPVRGGGSVTLKRKRMKTGLEPDRCFWIANAAKLAGVKRLDLKIHPPPDLALEVDVTSSSLDRFAIYRTLGVPEVWHLTGDVLEIHALTEGKYETAATSPTFAGIAAGDVMRFVIRARTSANENPVLADFREWVRATRGAH